MSQDEQSLEETIQKAIVDRDKLKAVEERNKELGRMLERYSKTVESVREKLGRLYNLLHEVQSEIQDLEDIW